MKHTLTLGALALAIAGCSAASKISMMPAASGAPPVNAIALAPEGGLLADAVGVELSNRGFKVIDAATTSRMMTRVNMSELATAQPESLAKLRDQGIDAVLSVQSAAGYDQLPQSASARVTSTRTGQVLAGMSWQNGWGGAPGSMADRFNRKGLVEAAQEIAGAIAANLTR